MTIKDFLDKHDLNRSLLIGYYGGGNFGDELLLEVLASMIKNRGVRQLDIVYQQPEWYQRYHHDFGYQLVQMSDKKALFKAIIRNKQLVVGGGGLWGLDVNKQTFLLGVVLWVSRWLLGKKVYALGVGYYSSTSRLGHFSAWLTAKAANYIIVRDEESLVNFRRFTKNVAADKDIVWYAENLDIKDYKNEVRQLEKQLAPNASGKRTLFITLRRFKKQYANDFTSVVAQAIAANPQHPIIIALMEPREIDPDGFEYITQLATQHKHVTVIDFSFNPLALVQFFKHHSRQLAYIGPQFHGLLAAQLAEVPYLPVVYDNKSAELFAQLGVSPTYSIYDLTADHVQAFIDKVAV